MLSQLRTAKSARPNPTVHLSFVLLRDNLHEVRAFVELASQLGTSTIIFGYAHLAPSLRSHSLFDLQASSDAVLQDVREYGRKKESRLWIKGYSAKRFFRCTYPWDSLLVLPDGRYAPCCGPLFLNTLRGDLDIGNLYTQSLAELRNHDYLQGLRKNVAHFGAGSLPPACARCAAGDSMNTQNKASHIDPCD